MEAFEIDDLAIKCAWNGENVYWYSKSTNELKNANAIADIDMIENYSVSESLEALGYIPFASVSDVEVMRTFIKTINNKKLVEALTKIDDDKLVDSFWKYFDLYPEMNTFGVFQDSFVKDKIIFWCNENNIMYK